MKTLFAYYAAVAIGIVGLTGCSETYKDETQTESTSTTPSGETVKTETNVEKKTTVD